MPDPHRDAAIKDISGLSDATLARELIVMRVILDHPIAAAAIYDPAYARAVIRELMARGWTEGEIIEQANNAP